MAIHPTAVIERGAELDSTVEVGAYAIIERGAQIAGETRVYSHAYVYGGARIGRRCQIHPFAVVAGDPQDSSFDGSASFVEIGEETIVREAATIHRGTEPGSKTVIGKRCFVMSGGHVGHNCQLGDDVTLTHGSVLAGRVVVQDRALIGGMCGVHQFCRIGELTMIAGGSLRVTADVPPFMTYADGGLVGPNTIGLKRAGFSIEERREIRAAYRTLFRSGLAFSGAVDLVDEATQTAPGRRLVEFLRAPAKRAIARPSRRAAREPDESDVA